MTVTAGAPRPRPAGARELARAPAPRPAPRRRRGTSGLADWLVGSPRELFGPPRGHRPRRGLRRPAAPEAGRAPDHTTGASSAVAWSVVAGVTALSCGLGLYHLGSRSLWLDEGYTWSISSLKASSVLHSAQSQGGHLVGYYLLVHLVIAVFGDSATAMRMPSVIAGAASVPVVYLLACRLCASRLAGMFASVLFAVSMPLVFWQQNARDYAFVVLLSAASSLLLVLAVQTASVPALFAWGLVSAVACYTHTESLLLGVAQLLPVVLWPSAKVIWRPLGLFLAAAAIGSLSPLLNGLDHAGAQSTFLGPPTGAVVREVVTFLASGAGTAGGVTGIDYTLLVLTALAWVAGLAIFAADVVRRGRTAANLGPALALSCLLVPVALAWVVSQLDRPVLLDRYLVVSLPAAAVVVAMVLVRIRPRAVGFYAVTFVAVFRFGVIGPTYSIPLDDFAGATSFVLAHARPGDCIAFYQNSERVLYDYYSVRTGPEAARPPHGPAQVLPPVAPGDNPSAVAAYAGLPPTYIASMQTPAYVAATASVCPRLWLFESHVGGPTGPSAQQSRFAGLLVLRQKIAVEYGAPTDTSFRDVEVQLYRRPPAPAR